MYNKQTPETIQSLFSTIAPSYDRANALISFGLHQLWNRRLVRAIKTAAAPSSPTLLDLCAGTGEIALNYVKKHQGATAYLLDFCQAMLDQAKIKADRANLKKPSLHYICGDAQKIPLPNHHVDCVTMAYGIRNLSMPQFCAEEVFRVLRPGGSWAILELTRPNHPWLRAAHSFHLKNVLPLMGRLVTSNQNAYEYLSKSIQSFVAPEVLKVMLQEVGFSSVEITPLLGGIATILVAKKKFKL